MLLVNLTPVQNYLVGQVTKTLSKRLDTKVSIDHVRIDFLNQLAVKGVYVQDHSNDTLLYAGELRLRITDWFIFRKGTAVIKYVGLHDAYVNLYRGAKSDQWNYQFIIDAFDSGPSTTPKKSSGPSLDLDLKKLDVKNVRFFMNDAWVGQDMNFVVGSLDLDADKIDLNKKIIDLDAISAMRTKVIFRDYEGGRPPKPKKPKSNVIDTTAFNPGKWAVNLGQLRLEDCFFSMDIDNDPPAAHEFDPAHIHVSNINIDAEQLVITGDTLTAELNNLSANERSGLILKKMQADVRVSPRESVCKNLLLETNNSRLEDYYAMHYSRFPDFNDYINKVVMVANLRKSKIDPNDVAYFAPVLRQYKTIINASGNFKGTVADIRGKKLLITDGYTTIKGDLHMKGLPDIDETLIDYNDGELFTSGEGLIRYAPSLRKNTAVDFESIKRAYFKGAFKGYIHNFALDGTLLTNLGTVRTDIKMKLPESKGGTFTYTGKLDVQQLNLGVLLRQPDLGTVSLNGDVSGSESAKLGVVANFKTVISELGYKGYVYRNMDVDGKLEKDKFDGRLFINDPNVSMAFYGLFDFSGEQLKINAKANLLQSNISALNLLTTLDSNNKLQDSITLSADFDLDWEGKNIDDFTGLAKLYNIDLRRNTQRLDLDSITVNASETDNGKLLVVQSNALNATISGRYQLSTLPYSFQYYVAGYLPNYIKAPAEQAPPQDLTFEINTVELDSLFALFVPSLSGFNNAKLSGHLATEKQQLEFSADIPYGMVSGNALYNSTLTANGNFNSLSAGLNVDSVVLADTSLSGSLGVTASLGNDNLAFTISTTSPDALEAVTLSGKAHAHGDTLDAMLEPSEFFLNGVQWKMPGGNKIVYTDGYLEVNNLYLQSGSQNISFQSKNNGLLQSLNVNMSGLDIYQLSVLAGLKEYNMKGTLNGDVRIDNMFSDIMVVSDIKATHVEMAGDTIGHINIVGSYDGKTRLADLDSRTGIYRDDKSLTASGRISFYDQNSQGIDGLISFNHTPLSWLTPVLTGFVSNITGTLDGKVLIKGTSASPDVQGKVNLDQVGMKVNFLGTYYRIPQGAITVNEKDISVGRLTIHDQFDNTAVLSGGISHKRFKDMRLNISTTSSKLEVINLRSNESDVFYGNLVAGFGQLSITGPFDNVMVNIMNARPAAKSHLYLPLSSGSNDMGAYSYITFRDNGESKEEEQKSKSKLAIRIVAEMNPLAEITMVLDASTGDAITASGTGTIQLDIPPDNDIRMTGRYTIDDGSYIFTLPQLFFKRKFILDKGSVIDFQGAIDNTRLNVGGIYKTKARLFDLLTPTEKNLIGDFARDETFAKETKDINVILYMRGSLGQPQLSFKLDLPDKSGAGTIAYRRVETVNGDDEELLKQVGSLLLINSFLPSGGQFEGAATAGAISNFGEMFSGTASSQLTNLLSKLTGDDDIAVDIKYKNYSYSNTDADVSGTRSAFSLNVKKNLFNDRVTLEVGSSVDWGKPTSSKSTTSTFNPVGDFRVQYQLKEGGALRGNIFRTSSYDVLADQNIARGGVGLSWKRSFDNLAEFFGSHRLSLEEQIRQRRDSMNKAIDTTNGGTE